MGRRARPCELLGEDPAPCPAILAPKVTDPIGLPWLAALRRAAWPPSQQLLGDQAVLSLNPTLRTSSRAQRPYGSHSHPSPRSAGLCPFRRRLFLLLLEITRVKTECARSLPALRNQSPGTGWGCRLEGGVRAGRKEHSERSFQPAGTSQPTAARRLNDTHCPPRRDSPSQAVRRDPPCRVLSSRSQFVPPNMGPDTFLSVSSLG